jgi:hypothetical protein
MSNFMRVLSALVLGTASGFLGYFLGTWAAAAAAWPPAACVFAGTIFGAPLGAVLGIVLAVWYNTRHSPWRHPRPHRGA